MSAPFSSCCIISFAGEVNSAARRNSGSRYLFSENQATGSEKGKRILSDFDAYLPKFKKIIPHDYRIITEAIEAGKQNGHDEDSAKIEAFYQLIRSR